MTAPNASTDLEASSPLRIGVIEDERHARTGISLELSALEPEGFVFAGAYESFDEFNRARVALDIMILDRWIRIRHADGSESYPQPQGHRAVAKLRERTIRVIMHTNDANPGHAAREMAAGAECIVSKSHQSPEPLYEALRAIRDGERLLTGPMASAIWTNEVFLRALELTESEKSVFKLKAAGFTGDQIARRAHISPKTVGNHVSSIHRKIDTILSQLQSGNDQSPRPQWLVQLLTDADPLRPEGAAHQGRPFVV
ncbi:MAG: LuxR C-terminal-related transcriptional regulator [Micropruina sp.]